MAADVDDTLPEWSTTESSNKPSGGTSVGTNLDDNIRMLQKVVRGWLASKGSDIASASTTDLGAVEGLAHDITGTTAITSFGTIGAGILKVLKFEGALTLTHNATSLILPGGANITTADGDVALVISEGSGNWRCLVYAPNAGSTGSGSFVRATSPTLVTPALGTPSSGTLTNCTGLPQGGLSTTTGEVSTTSASETSLTLPGGTYGFYPQVRASSAASAYAAFIGGTFGSVAWTTSYVTKIVLQSNGTATALAQQRYIQASPPYNLGDGDIPIFIFALVDSSGNVIATYSAEDPPWAHNGPTDITPDKYVDGKPMKFVRPRLMPQDLKNGVRVAPNLVEVTQAMKQADMPIVPHPFLGNDLTGKTVVLLDPMSNLVLRLQEQRAGEKIADLLHEGRLNIGNQRINRAAPPSVMPVSVSWR